MSAPAPAAEDPAPADPASARSGPVRRGPVFGRLGLALVGFVIGFWWVDLWVGRLDARGQQDGDGDYYMRDERLGWVPRPHFENPEFGTLLDSRGMRNPELAADVPSDELRIAGFGASMLYGAAGVHQDDIWSARLDRAFAGGFAGHQGSVRFLNGGVMGYSAVQASRRAIELLPELEPDLVFVLVSPGPQSLLDPSAARNWVRSSGRLVRRDVVEGWPELLHPALIELHELMTCSSIYTRHKAKLDLGNEDREASVQRWVLSRDPDDAATAAMVARTFEELAALGAAASEAGVALRVMVFPEQAQASELAWERFCRNNAARGAPPVGTPRTEPTEVLLERSRAVGLACWDFTPEVEALGAGRARLLAEDGRHWTADGHAVVAEGLARRLREGLLDELLERRRGRTRRTPAGREEQGPGAAE